MAKKKMGRPTIYDADVTAKIINRLMDGESIRTICLDDDMPSRATIHNWLSTNRDFLDQYTQAREIQADHIFDEMFDIADDGTNDWMMRQQGDDELEVVNHEHIQRSRLRIDTRKWALARMAPKKYGDKLDLSVGGNGSPIETKELSDREYARRTAFLLRRTLAQGTGSAQGGNAEADGEDEVGSESGSAD